MVEFLLLFGLPIARKRTPMIWLKKLLLVFILWKILTANMMAGMERKEQQMMRMMRVVLLCIPLFV